MKIVSDKKWQIVFILANALVLLVSLIYKDLSVEDFVLSIVIYVYFFRWIFYFITRKKMPLPLYSDDLSVGKHDAIRFILLIISVVFCFVVIFY